MECAVSLKPAVIGQMDEKATVGRLLINNPEHWKQKKTHLNIPAECKMKKSTILYFILFTLP